MSMESSSILSSAIFLSCAHTVLLDNMQGKMVDGVLQVEKNVSDRADIVKNTLDVKCAVSPLFNFSTSINWDFKALQQWNRNIPETTKTLSWFKHIENN